VSRRSGAASFARRRLLAGLGTGVASFIARPLLRDCFAQAGPPRRVLFIYMPNCGIRASWVPAGGRNPAMNQGDPRQFTLAACNEPLAPVREQMTMISGLDVKSIVGCNHGSAIIRVMSNGSGRRPVAPSFDQVLRERAPLLQGTQIASLQLGTDTRADAGSNGIQLRVMSYDSKGPLPPEIEPVKTYTRVFSPLATTSGGDASAAEREAALARTLAEQKSVLDAIKGDLGRLQRRLPGREREKLDQHLEGLREVERSLSAGSGAGAFRGAGTLPGPPPALAPNVSTNHKQVIDQYLSLIKLAFQFDVTRVVTFMFASGNSQVSLGDFLPGHDKGPLHRLAHAYKAPALIAASRWYTGIVAGYLQELAAIQEADGSSLLDNTLVPFFSEVAQYHEHNDIPFALFGGRKLGHTGGRALRYPGRTPSDVWLPVARAFGVDMGSFGDAQYNAGPLPELFS
jgi:hypothetical protein